MKQLSSQLQSRISKRRAIIAGAELDFSKIEARIALYDKFMDEFVKNAPLNDPTRRGMYEEKRKLRSIITEAGKSQKLDKELMQLVYAKERREQELHPFSGFERYQAAARRAFGDPVCLFLDVGPKEPTI